LDAAADRAANEAESDLAPDFWIVSMSGLVKAEVDKKVTVPRTVTMSFQLCGDLPDSGFGVKSSRADI
jgi:hypothetical protein